MRYGKGTVLQCDQVKKFLSLRSSACPTTSSVKQAIIIMNEGLDQQNPIVIFQFIMTKDHNSLKMAGG